LKIYKQCDNINNQTTSCQQRVNKIAGFSLLAKILTDFLG
jgi:hypothetical protein